MGNQIVGFGFNNGSIRVMEMAGDPIVVAHGIASFTEHKDQPYKVSGILARTGTPVDRTVIVSLEAIEAIHVDWQSGVQRPGQPTPAEVIRQMDLTPGAVTAALVGVQSPLQTFALQRAINQYPEEPMPDRRSALLMLSAGATLPGAAFAATPREIMWDDLIPPGVPYSEIIGEGEIDEVNDLWNPVYDENAVRLNEALDQAYIRMPGYMIPFDMSSKGVTGFMLVPYVGACIHVPPPPANQLVMARTERPWPAEQLWDAVWVTGTLCTGLQSTKLGTIGYSIECERIEAYEW